MTKITYGPLRALSLSGAVRLIADSAKEKMLVTYTTLNKLYASMSEKNTSAVTIRM